MPAYGFYEGVGWDEAVITLTNSTFSGTDYDIYTVEDSVVNLNGCYYGTIYGGFGAIIQPMPGDRAAWDAVYFPAFHSRDLGFTMPTRHNPWPAAAGDAPVSDGAKWVATPVALKEHTHELQIDFLDLFDAPTSFKGHATEFVRVNDSETGLVFSGIDVIANRVFASRL